MSNTPIPQISPDDENPADDLKTDVKNDVRREHTVTSDASVEPEDGAEPLGD